MSGWIHANAARAERRMKRRAVYLAAVESGMPKGLAAATYGISVRTGRRYLTGAI